MANEKRLIDANDMKRDIMEAMMHNFMKNGDQIALRIGETLCHFVDVIPTVDAVEVVHGRWEKSIDNETVMHKCSVCGARVVKGIYEYENPNRYCYHCGAKMDGGDTNDER